MKKMNEFSLKETSLSKKEITFLKNYKYIVQHLDLFWMVYYKGKESLRFKGYTLKEAVQKAMWFSEGYIGFNRDGSLKKRVGYGDTKNQD